VSAGVYPGLAADLFGDVESAKARIRWMLGLSLLLHVGLVMLLAGLRISKVERPLASYEVSLVTLPTPQPEASATSTKPAEPMETKPVETPPQKPTPPVKHEKVEPVHLPPPPQARPTPRPITPPAPSKLEQPAPAVSSPKPRMDAPAPTAPPTPPPPAPPPRPSLNREVLKGFSLPEVPKLAEVKPPPAAPAKETTRQTEEEVQKLLKNLQVPEPSVERPRAVDPPKQPAAPAVSDELTSQLQKLKQQAAIPPPPPPQPRPTQRTEPVVAAKPPAMKTPVTTLQLPGLTQGNPYLAAIQKRISSQWIAPPVDVSGTPLQVIVKFRLDRTGNVSGIAIEQSSGNEYYDLAAKRAVVAANPLPPFPQDLTLPYLDAHFSFSVGEPVS